MTRLPDQLDRDVVVIGGCGHVGLPLALAFADRGARVGIYDVSQAAVDTVNAGRMPFAEPGAEEVLHRVPEAGRLEASADPAIVATAEHVIVVIGTPVDEHLNPDQTAITKALGGCSDYLRDGQLLVLRSTVFPGRHGNGGEDDRQARTADRRRVLPGANRRGQGDDRAVRAAADRLRPARRRGRSGRRAVRQADQQARRDVAGRSRAGQAVHQRLALHQVRHRQPALHDGQRAGPGLRADPARPDRGLPAGRGHARRGLRRRTLPVQGHDAARGLQPQQLPARPRGMAVNEGLPLYMVHRIEQRFDLAVDDRRDPGHGVQGGLRRHPVQPVLQAQTDPGVQGRRGPLHRPVRDRRPDLLPLDEVLARPTCSSSRRLTRSTGDW